MKVILSTIGKFHFFSLAKELYTHGVLDRIYTGYPKWKARADGLPMDLVKSSSLGVVAKAVLGKSGVLPDFIGEFIDRRNFAAHDRWVADDIDSCDIFHGLSRYNLLSGRRAQSMGAKYICDVGSSHISTQSEILESAYREFGLDWPKFHSRDLERELSEYEAADMIFVLSKFALRSFVEHGTPEYKLRCIPLGVDLSRFYPASSGSPPGIFRVLFVGGMTVRKGIPVLAKAFRMARMPASELVFVGSEQPETKQLLAPYWDDDMRIVGHVPNSELAAWYQSASVLVLPSFEDGFGMVVLEALACGCPAIVSTNTGAADAIHNGVNGFVIQTGDAEALENRLTEIYRSKDLREHMSAQASKLAVKNWSWERYGESVVSAYREISAN